MRGNHHNELFAANRSMFRICVGSSRKLSPLDRPQTRCIMWNEEKSYEIVRV